MLPRLLTNLVLIVIACLLGVRAFESLHFLRPAMTPADLGEPLGAATMWKLASVRDDPKWTRSPHPVAAGMAPSASPGPASARAARR